MKLRRRIVLVLGSSKYPLKEEELTFIKSSTHNNLGEVISTNSQAFTLAFGARKVRESDIENSLTVCIAIREHIPATKFGVSYGLVSVDEKKDGSIKIEGKITNIVKHLSSIASHSHISVDESITKIYSRVFDIRHIKAKDKDVYNVYGFKKTPSRIRGLREAYGKLIGRDKEFAELQNLLLQIASDQGQMVGVVGEAGIGKTRITHELKTLLKMRGIKYFEGSFPYFGGSTYKGFKDIISQIANITSQDPIQNIEKKLKRIGDKYNLEKPDVDFLINLFVILPTSDVIKNLNEEQIKLGTFVAVKKLIFKIAENPLVIILEDMQNADELSASLADFMAEGLPEMKLLFYMNYRPEFHGKFEEKIYFNWIRLKRFDEQKAKEFLSSLLDIELIPKKLLRLIQKKSAGNPLYIEELVRSLLDKGKIKVENNQLKFTEDINPSDIQPTIHGVISYRIEKLPQEASQVLKWGSCIGDEIDVKLLKTILKRNVSKDIEELELKDFIYEVSIYPEEIYKFRHDLIREVSYESLPLNQKRSIHLKIGNYLEKKYKFEIEERLEDLANHFIKSTDYSKAFNYSYKAAQKLKSNYSNEEAIRLFETAYDFVNKVKIKDKKEVKKKIIKDLIEIYTMISNYKKAHEMIKRYSQILRKRNEIEELNRVKGEVLKSEGLFPSAEQYLKRGISFDNDELDNVKAISALIYVFINLGKIDEAVKYANKAISLIENKYPDEMGYIYNLLGLAFYYGETYEDSIKYFEKSIGILESVKSLSKLQVAYLNVHLPLVAIGKMEHALMYLEKSASIAKSLGALKDLGIIYMNTAIIFMISEQYKKGLDKYLQAKSMLEKVQSFHALSMIYSNLCSEYLILGVYPKAKFFLSKSREYLEKVQSKFWLGVNCQLEGLIEGELENHEKSDIALKKSLDIFSEISHYSKYAEVLADLVNLYYKKNDKNKIAALGMLIDDVEKKSLWKKSKEKLFYGKVRLAHALKKRPDFLKPEALPSFDNWNCDFKFDTFIALSGYYSKILGDMRSGERFYKEAESIYRKIYEEVPEELKKDVKNKYEHLLSDIKKSL